MVIFLSMIFISCKNNELESLKIKISELENTNKKLQDSLDKRNSFLGTEIIGIPEEIEYKINEKGRANFILFKHQVFPKYNVYEIDEKNEKKILIKNSTNSNFKYEFIPRKLPKDNVNLILETEIKGQNFEIPIRLDFFTKH